MSPEVMNIVNQIFQIVIIPILGALTVFAVKWINAKANSIKAETDNALLQKYTDMVAETISKCVLATNQTYVDALKQQGSFDMEAQKVAFKMTYDAVLEILSEEAKVYLTEAVGDFEEYLKQLIEAEVKTVSLETAASKAIANGTVPVIAAV